MAEALAELPRQRPSAGFTDEVLARLDMQGAGSASSRGRLIWATATSLILALLLTLGYSYQRQRAAERAYRDQVEQLRSRYQQLLDEVANVRQEVSTPDTRLYLGGDESLDLVLDFSQNPTFTDSRQGRTDIRPATWEQ